MGFGDDEAKIVENIAQALPGSGDGDAESDGLHALGAAGHGSGFVGSGAWTRQAEIGLRCGLPSPEQRHGSRGKG